MNKPMMIVAAAALALAGCADSPQKPNPLNLKELLAFSSISWAPSPSGSCCAWVPATRRFTSGLMRWGASAGMSGIKMPINGCWHWDRNTRPNNHRCT